MALEVTHGATVGDPYDIDTAALTPQPDAVGAVTVASSGHDEMSRPLPAIHTRMSKHRITLMWLFRNDGA